MPKPNVTPKPKTKKEKWGDIIAKINAKIKAKRGKKNG